MNSGSLIKSLGIILRQATHSYSEYALIQCLIARGDLSADFAANSLTLFRTHFRLMNGLYQLQQIWLLEGCYLRISPLAIYVETKTADDSASNALDISGVREFYLNWQYFEIATEESVAQLLNDFWCQLARGGVSDSEQTEALTMLELQAPQNFTAIKKQYRRLVMRHHPDRGGDAEQVQKINYAMAVLERCYAK